MNDRAGPHLPDDTKDRVSLPQVAEQMLFVRGASGGSINLAASRPKRERKIAPDEPRNSGNQHSQSKYLYR